MKAITPKDFVPKDPVVKTTLKRIALIAGIHIALGSVAATFGTTAPVLALIALLLCASILGLIHWLSLEPTDTEATIPQLGLTALFTVLACLSLLIPLLILAPSLWLLCLGGLCFVVAHFVHVLTTAWANWHVSVPEKVEVLDWVQAFLQGLVIPNSRYYVYFKLRDEGKQKSIGLPVDYDQLYQQGEITVQALWSNWVWRYNERATAENLILTKQVRKQREEDNYLFSFYQYRFFFFKKYLSPKVPFKELKCRWQLAAPLNDFNQRLLIRAFVIYVDRYESQMLNSSREEYQ